MRKLKFLILTLLSVLTLGLFVVTGSKVNAATYDFRTISADGTKSSWDFTSFTTANGNSSNVAIGAKKTDVVDGLTTTDGKGKLNKNGCFELPSGKNLYIAVPSGSSAGNFKFIGHDNSDTRVAKIGETEVASKSSEQTISFTSGNVTTIADLGGYWLVLNSGSSDSLRMDSFSVTLTSNDNYKSIFTVNFYKETTDTETYANFSVVDGNTISAWPQDPSKEGYDFAGWATSSNVSYTASSAITSDLDLYAQWEQSGAEKVDVIFNSNGGSSVATQSVVVGKTASQPTDPIKDGFTFVGWFDSTLTNEYDFTSSVTAEITLYAKWVKALNKETVVLGTFALTGSKDDLIISETSAGDFTLLATDNKNGDNYNQHFTIANGTTVNSVKYNLSLKTNGASSFDSKFRLIKFTADGKSTITAVSQSANSSHEARDMYLYNSIGNLVDSVTVTDPNSYVLNVPSSGDYYIGCQNGLYFYDIKLEAETAVPTVSLYKDINSDNHDEIRLVVKIDNLSIDGSNLNYIKNVKIEIEGTSYSKTISKVYRAVDSATTGNYKKEDNVCYAVQSFKGYSNASSAFTFKVTVNYVGGSVVETIEVPAYSA